MDYRDYSGGNSRSDIENEVMEKYPTYKRTKVNWWIIILLGGFYICMIVSYIHQWGNSPIDKAGLVIFAIINIVVILCVGRIKVIVDDKFVVYRTDVWIPVKIIIMQIKNVSLAKVNFKETSTAKIDRYGLEFTRKMVCIQLKNRKAVHIVTKDAEQIKEEIDKRMLIANNN